MLPYTMVSGLLLVISLLLIKGKHEAVVIKEETNMRLSLKKNIIYLILFALSLLSVAKILHYMVVLILVLLVVFIMEKDVLKSVDYCCFWLLFVFLFSREFGKYSCGKDTLQNLITGRELVISVFASQAISNVQRRFYCPNLRTTTGYCWKVWI